MFQVANKYEQSLLDQLRMECFLLNHRKFRTGIHVDSLCESCGVPEHLQHFVVDCRNVSSASIAMRRTLKLLPWEWIHCSLSELVDNPKYCKIILKCLKKKLAPLGQTQSK